jgi:hypothetical protein
MKKNIYWLFLVLDYACLGLVDKQAKYVGSGKASKEFYFSYPFTVHGNPVSLLNHFALIMTPANYGEDPRNSVHL